LKKLTGQFHFKQFSIYHHNSTMKVGTDAILLAVWCDIYEAKTILDVGTGSGIIALLLASRTNAKIDAIEMDNMSVAEASANFNNFRSDNLKIIHDDFIVFASQTNQKYDLIVSNPPFFSNSLLPEIESKKAARHTNSLTHWQLCKGVVSILSANGSFSLVLPYNTAPDFIKIANSFNLYLRKQLTIHPKPNRAANRVNMEFCFNKPDSIINENIIIRKANGQHTEQYKKYVSDYISIL